MSNIPCHAVCSASVPQNGYVYSGMLQYSGTHRLSVNLIRVSAGGPNTLTKPLLVELYRVATASISGGTATTGTTSKRNLNDSGAITGVSCQSLTSAATVTSPVLLDSGYFKPDGGSFTFSAGYYVEAGYTLFVKVTDANNVSAIAATTSFTLDV